MYKVCHMTSAHPRYDPRILEKECTSLAKAGFQVYLIVNDDKADEQYNGVNIVSTGMTFSGRRARMTKGAKAVYKQAIELDADVFGAVIFSFIFAEIYYLVLTHKKAKK